MALVTLALLVVALILEWRLMAQVDDLRSAISQLGTDLSEAIARVETKISELGEPDPDLTNDIAAIREASAKLDSLAAGEPPAEVVPPVEEPAVEPSTNGSNDFTTGSA